MQSSQNFNLDYDRPVKNSRRCFSGLVFYDAELGLHCNPYLVVDGEEAVVIDGGKQAGFSFGYDENPSDWIGSLLRSKHWSTTITIRICVEVFLILKI